MGVTLARFSANVRMDIVMFPIKLILPIEKFSKGQVLNRGDVPNFMAELWVKNGIAKPVKKGK